MKNILLTGIFSCFCVLTFAQTEISFTINHKLGTEPFAFNQPAVNNMGHDFDLIRLQYYISEIVLTHDGGTKTSVDDTWILVDASTPDNVVLGDYNITELEGLAFSIGVDSSYNHTDPALYPAGHPLAPVFPSMHWGWASGYRFMALEGNGGPNLDQRMELHGLGDENYFQISLRFNRTADNGMINVGVDADYTRLLEDIILVNGPVVHGINKQAQDMLENARDYTFTLASENSGLLELDGDAQYRVYPNPTTNQHVSVQLETDVAGEFSLVLVDMLGRSMSPTAISQNSIIEFNLPETKGIYFMQLMQDGKLLDIQKIINE